MITSIVIEMTDKVEGSVFRWMVISCIVTLRFERNIFFTRRDLLSHYFILISIILIMENRLVFDKSTIVTKRRTSLFSNSSIRITRRTSWGENLKI